MSESTAERAATLGTPRWQGQAIRVEHLVAPGGWLTRGGKHLGNCACRCAEVQICPQCRQPSSPVAISGRWDPVAGYTARPFDPVWVRLYCGCEFGDKSLASPTPPPPTAAATEAGTEVRKVPYEEEYGLVPPGTMASGLGPAATGRENVADE